MKIYEEDKINTVEYVAELALLFERAAWGGEDGPGVGPTDGKIVAMGLRLLAAQLPSQAALIRAEAMSAAMARV